MKRNRDFKLSSELEELIANQQWQYVAGSPQLLIYEAAIAGDQPAVFRILRSSAEGERYKLLGRAVGGAIEGKSMDTIRSLVNFGLDPTWLFDSMHLAAGSGFCELLCYCFDRGADVNAADALGASLLDHAVRGRAWDACLLLLESGANVETPEAHGYTPLMQAAMQGDPRIVELLVRSGSSVDTARAESHETVLHLAAGFSARDGWCEHPDEYERVLQILVDAGADVECRESEGQTPLHYAAMSSSAHCCSALLRLGADVNAEDVHGHTPFLMSCGNRQPDTTKILINAGANINVRNMHGMSPAMLCAGNPAVLRECIQAGANIGGRTEEGDSVLHLASYYGSVESVQVLLAAGANPLDENADCKTPIDLASEHSHSECVNVLMNYLASRGLI